MSSILKALEKVEESQNTRRSGGGNAFVISRKRRPGWVIPAGVLGGAVVASLVTFAFMGGLSRPAPQVASLQAAPNQTAAVPPAPAQLVPSYQVVEEPAVRPEQTLTRQPAEAVAVPAKVAAPVKVAAPARVVALPTKVVAVPAKRSPAPARPPAAKARPRPAALPFQDIPVVQPSAAEIAAARFRSPPAAVPLPKAQATGQASRQDLRVTGIAWQKESGSSAAIVNGRTLKEGATVDGYKVERIFENHVTFSGSNGRLKIPLGGGE